MSRERDDGFWRCIEQAGWPSPQELADTERELAATETSRLPPTMIERIVGEATSQFEAERLGAATRLEQHATGRVLAGAATALLCIVSIGWIGANICWPTERPISEQFVARPDLPLTILLIPESDRLDPVGDARWRAAMVAAYGDTKHSSRALAALADDGDSEIAAAAEQALSRWCDGATVHVTITATEAKNAATTAMDANAPPASRIAAIARIEQFLAASVVAINETEATRENQSETKRRSVRKLEILLDDHRQARSPASPPRHPER